MYPSSRTTFILKNNSIQQIPRINVRLQAQGLNSFSGTADILSFPSVKQGVKTLPINTPGGKTRFFFGKRF